MSGQHGRGAAACIDAVPGRAQEALADEVHARERSPSRRRICRSGFRRPASRRAGAIFAGSRERPGHRQLAGAQQLVVRARSGSRARSSWRVLSPCTSARSVGSVDVAADPGTQRVDVLSVVAACAYCWSCQATVASSPTTTGTRITLSHALLGRRCHPSDAGSDRVVTRVTDTRAIPADSIHISC